MEDLELTRADRFAAAFRGIINKTNCPAFWAFFHTPGQLDGSRLKEAETITENLWREASNLAGQLYECSPDLSDIPALLARIRQQNSRLEIPSDLRGYIFKAFPAGNAKQAARQEIACNVGRTIEEYREQVEDITNYLQSIYPATVEAAPLEAGRTWIVPEPAPGQPERLYIETDRSPDQLKEIYRKLVNAAYLAPGKQADFLRCFDPEAATQGRIYCDKKGKNLKPNKKKYIP